MKTVANILWFIFASGWLVGLMWWFVGLIAYATIIGIPWGKACFVMGNFAFHPFGRTAMQRDKLNKKTDIGTSGWGALGNLIWFLFLGIWIGLIHLLLAVASFVTIIGIPFGIQHYKLACASLFPIGITVVSNELAIAAKSVDAMENLNAIRSNN